MMGFIGNVKKREKLTKREGEGKRRYVTVLSFFHVCELRILILCSSAQLFGEPRAPLEHREATHGAPPTRGVSGSSDTFTMPALVTGTA